MEEMDLKNIVTKIVREVAAGTEDMPTELSP